MAAARGCRDPGPARRSHPRRWAARRRPRPLTDPRSARRRGTDPSRSAFAASAECVPPSASALRQEVFEQDRRCAGVEVTCAPNPGLARGVALVVQPNGNPELLRAGPETPDALGLVPFLAA